MGEPVRTEHLGHAALECIAGLREELARVREELERERGESEKRLNRLDRYWVRKGEELTNELELERQRAEQAESRLAELQGGEAVERAAEVLWDQAEREHADYVNGRYQPKPWSTARIQDRKDYLALARSALEAALLGRGGE